MKKFLVPVLALALAACTTEPSENIGGKQDGDSQPGYITISLVTSAVSKAADTGENEYDANGGKYEDGTPTENDVTSVRFYFFNGNNAAIVKNDSESYYDWTPDGSGIDHANSVERILEATLVIDTAPNGEGDKIPTSIVAVLNPPTALTTGVGQNLSLTALNQKIADYSLTAVGSFVMSNSVYADGNTKVEAVPVEGHLYTTEEAAKGDPVILYVERVLAKVGLTTSLANAGTTEGVYATSSDDKYKATDTSTEDNEEVSVYVKFLGWNVTQTTTTSRLMKEINANWGAQLLGSEPWNWEGHRSFWAVNPAGVAVAYTKFEGEGSAQANQLGATVYTQENAATGTGGETTETPTEIIIAAQLCDAQGNELEIAEYASKLYKGRDAVKDLLANAANIYTLSTAVVDNATADDYTKIDKTVLDFATASEVEDKTPQEMEKEEEARYYVYAVLAESAEGTDYYYRDGVDDDGLPKFSKYADDKAVNDALKKLGHAKVWANGRTYYYFPVRHLNSNENQAGYYGIVRNHVYKNNISALSGLGTPVYNPEEVIIPEKPVDDDTVIAAQIEILSWRVVRNDDVQLEW